MKKARVKFILYAMAAVAVLLTVLLSVINITVFSLAAEDADAMLERLSNAARPNSQNFPEDPNEGFNPDTPKETSTVSQPGSVGRTGGNPGFFGRFTPDGNDLPLSARYFSVKIEKNGEKKLTKYNISAYTEDEALNLAERLSSGNTSGWTGVYYRYRVDKSKGLTVVTVLDQSRELLPAWRILLFSVAGELVGLAVCLLFLTIVSKKIFRPLEEADRKQLAFTVEAEKRFKVPLTVINLNAELLERKYGPDESTQAIRTEVRKMSETTRQLAKFHLVEDQDVSAVPIDVSAVLSKTAEAAKDRLNSSDVTLISEIEPGITLCCDGESFRKIAEELIDNIRKFAAGEAVISLKKERGHVVLVSENDTLLPDGSYDQVFDRFTRLGNADGVPGYGLGLAYFKDTVLALGGRVAAASAGGRFTVKAVF